MYKFFSPSSACLHERCIGFGHMVMHWLTVALGCYVIQCLTWCIKPDGMHVCMTTGIAPGKCIPMLGKGSVGKFVIGSLHTVIEASGPAQILSRAM